MNLLEHLGKRLLARGGVRTPAGLPASSPEEAATAARTLGSPVVLKSQVPAGRRGKAGAIRFAASPDEARQEAARLLGSRVHGHVVTTLLVEEQVDIARELYAAVLNDPAGKGPLVLFSTSGGMDVEEAGAHTPEKVLHAAVDIRVGLDEGAAAALLARSDVAPEAHPGLARTLVQLYRLYRETDAALVEVNPLVVTGSGDVVALDAKISLDPGALPRHQDLVTDLSAEQPETATALEQQGRELGFQFLELEGDVGVLANGAGLTMTTLDAVHHYGGTPANFLEIGGDAYTKATPALRLVLANPRVRSLLVNFCGAFARTDVMAEGVVAAIEELRPRIPVFFSIHGTGEEEAVALVRSRLGVEPYDLMDDAVQAAVAAAGAGAVQEVS